MEQEHSKPDEQADVERPFVRIRVSLCLGVRKFPDVF